MKTIEKILADQIKFFRKLKGWNQSTLAEKCNKGLSTIAQIETCVIWPQPDTVRAIAKALEVDEGELFNAKAAASQDNASDLRALIALVAALDDSQVRRYLAAMRMELAAQAGAVEPRLNPNQRTGQDR